MRRFNELDEAIAQFERDVATRRRALESNLRDADLHFRRSVASPKVLLGTVFAGYLVGRLINPPLRGEPAAAKRVGIVGALGGLAVSLLRAQVATPDSWLNEFIARRRRASAAAGDRPAAETTPPRRDVTDGAPASTRSARSPRV